MLRPIPIIASPFRDALRDALIDEFREKGPRRALRSVIASLSDWKKEKHPYRKRRKWCFAVLFRTGELTHVAHAILRDLGVHEQPAAEVISGREDNWVTGGLMCLFGGACSDSDLVWDDWYLDKAFDSEEDARQFANALREDGMPAIGPYESASGRWHVYINRSEFSP